MSAYTPSSTDNKPGSMVSWVLPLILIISLIGLLSYIVLVHPSESSEKHLEKTHAEA